MYRQPMLKLRKIKIYHKYLVFISLYIANISRDSKLKRKGIDGQIKHLAMSIDNRLGVGCLTVFTLNYSDQMQKGIWTVLGMLYQCLDHAVAQ